MYSIPKLKLSVVNDGPRFQSDTITQSAIAEEILRELAYNDGTIELYESFFTLVLNRANKVLGCIKISQGGTAGTVVDAKILFAAALAVPGCSALILAHNHPSGNLKPSQADIDLTRKLKKAGELLDIVVLDHLILSATSYRSLADEGLM